MVIERPWKSLTIKGDYPLLFLKARLDDTRCVLELTDLNRLWIGRLTRDELLQSAHDQGTSIDPCEDDEQYEQFLLKVNNALDGERKTSISLEPGAEEDSLQLSVSAPLPGLLPTFKWTAQLHRVDNDNGSVFERDILTPLLIHANNLMSQVQHLIVELGHKDRVIGKIADKLENVGQDLGQVFPGASNPRSTKATKRAQLASHVEGLAEFDAEKWQATVTKDIDEEDLLLEEMNRLFARLPEAGLVSAHRDTTGIWWRARGVPVLNEDVASDDDIRTGTSAQQTRSRNQTYPSATQQSKDNDDFQQQLTPPRPASDDDHDDDDEIEDEDDLDAPSQKASKVKNTSQNGTDSSQTLSHGRISSQSQEATLGRARSTEAPPKRSIGVVGGRRSARSKTPEVEPEPVKEEVFSSPAAKAAPERRKFGVIGRKTRSSPAPEPESEPPSDVTPKRTKKFGTFGGHAKTPSSPPPGVFQASPGKRLGMFGGRSHIDSQGAQADADATAQDSSRRGADMKETSQVAHDDRNEERPSRTRIKTEEEVEQQERDDSEERANVRREKLKRDIEEKTKGPVKKKRKF